ncbi:hypothetical protein H5410_048657 [Solanum commersonii]|uniref:DUF7086 domain-containing protein n=1 Tax=Solanum commersonii TaxID=4109 RepID=A0A9J5XL43_SOLCO|nr:hypothetical protein H5410_048657 [Solanum commersonii]
MNNHNNEENNEEINRKRKNFHTHFENRCENLLEEEEDDDELLKLLLMTPFRSTRPRIQPRENIESLSPLILENHESSTLNLPQLAILTPTILKKETGQRKRRNSLKPKPMLGCCTLDELKFFCEHTDNHRTGAKDRVLFLAYLTLCRQVDPTGPFHR